eukprot:10671547-Ditylum_brightwellii.AAC.1
MEGYCQTQAKKCKASKEEVNLQKTKFVVPKKYHELFLNDNKDLSQNAQFMFNASRKYKAGPKLDTSLSAQICIEVSGVTTEPFARTHLKRMKATPSWRKHMRSCSWEKGRVSSYGESCCDNFSPTCKLGYAATA